MKPFILTTAALLHLPSIALAQSQWSPPSAAISWDHLRHARVYAVDPAGQVREWQWDSTGQWTGPSYIGATAKLGTTVAATNDGDRLRVYYTNQNGRIAERYYEYGWYDGFILP